jgi:Plant mobile domain
MNNIQIDPALITALVERWRPATHTFYMHMGEVTVTLQNVAVLWGLSNNGYPIIMNLEIFDKNFIIFRQGELLK